MHLILSIAVIGLMIPDSQEAPAFFTAMRGKKSSQIPDYVYENLDYQLLDKILPEKWIEEGLTKRNALQYGSEEHKDLQISDSQEAPSFFTAMRGKKSYQVPDYVSENTDYQFMDKLLPEKWTEDDLITNNNRNAVQYALEEHKDPKNLPYRILGLKGNKENYVYYTSNSRFGGQPVIKPKAEQHTNYKLSNGYYPM